MVLRSWPHLYQKAQCAQNRPLVGKLLFLAGAIMLYIELICSESKDVEKLFMKYYHVGILLQSVGVVICANALENTKFYKKVWSCQLFSRDIHDAFDDSGMIIEIWHMASDPLREDIRIIHKECGLLTNAG